MRILYITDIHGNKKKIHIVLEKEKNSDLIIIGGDITQRGDYKDAEKIMLPLVESKIRIIAVHGNMDGKGVIEYLEEKNMSIHGRCVLLDDIAFIGLGGSNPTPMHTPHEYTDEEGDLILRKSLSEMIGVKKKIFISHAPPIHTKIDIIKSNIHVGSGLVREIIENNFIDLCVCGHIHEAAGIDNIGKSICVNPGAFRDGHYAVVDVTDSGINVKRRYI